MSSELYLPVLQSSFLGYGKSQLYFFFFFSQAVVHRKFQSVMCLSKGRNG